VTTRASTSNALDRSYLRAQPIETLLRCGNSYDGRFTEPESSLKEIIGLPEARAEVEALLADDLRLQRAAQGSYRHTLGFEKILIAQGRASGPSFRLHIWWPRTDATNENAELRVHSHRWDFESRVLAGSLMTEVYEPSASGTTMYAYECLPPLGQGFHRMKALGRLALRCCGRAVHAKGSFYRLSHEVMHTARADATKLTATLVARGPLRVRASVVCSSRHIINHRRIELVKLSAPEVRDVLKRFLSATESC
jgi:hypothetical protein